MPPKNTMAVPSGVADAAIEWRGGGAPLAPATDPSGEKVGVPLMALKSVSCHRPRPVKDMGVPGVLPPAKTMHGCPLPSQLLKNTADAYSRGKVEPPTVAIGTHVVPVQPSHVAEVDKPVDRRAVPPNAYAL